jgi:hypothetical protein
MAEFTVPHSVLFEMEGRANVVEVAKSLVAQDKLFREAVAVLGACFPDLDIEHVTVNLREIVQDSPMRHRLEGYIVAAFSPQLIEDMPGDILQALFGVDVPDRYDDIVSILILLIGVWGVERVVKKIKQSKKDGEKRKTEEEERFLAAERRRLTKEAANRASVTEETMEEALNETLGRRQRSVERAGMDFMAPARRHKATSISLPQGTAIGEEAIQAVPSDVDLAQYEPATDTVEMENVLVTFRAHDRDRAKHWAATISAISPDRKPLHLAMDIKAESLFVRDSVRADVLVTYVRDADGEYVPSLYYLSKVHDEEPAQ